MTGDRRVYDKAHLRVYETRHELSVSLENFHVQSIKRGTCSGRVRFTCIIRG